MPQIKITTIGDWNRTTEWLAKVSQDRTPKSLDRIGKQGVDALSAGTPKDSGETASSWYYTIEGKSVVWKNNAHPQTRLPVALLIQYGHGTRTGGYVPPIDYINPALRSIFSNAGNLLAKEMFE